MRKEVNEQYFSWLCSLIDDGRVDDYQMLLKQLMGTGFHYTMPMDGNRLADGIDLRYRFGREADIRDPIIAVLLDDKPGSVLEVMVALAVRCEEQIMDNPDIGNRTATWFWGMVDSLGLASMANRGYDARYVEIVLERFMNREYEYNGCGGLFTVKYPKKDMRGVDIWYQMCMFLETIL